MPSRHCGSSELGTNCSILAQYLGFKAISVLHCLHGAYFPPGSRERLWRKSWCHSHHPISNCQGTRIWHAGYLICHLRFVKGLPEGGTRIVHGYGGVCVGAGIRQQTEYQNYYPGVGRTSRVKRSLIIFLCGFAM